MKKNKRKPHLKERWCIAQITGESRWRMEEVLRLYELPYDPQRPAVCVDERPCQLVGDVMAPLPMPPGRPRREDDEYERNGTCVLFMAFEPLAPRRIVQVRSQRPNRRRSQGAPGWIIVRR